MADEDYEKRKNQCHLSAKEISFEKCMNTLNDEKNKTIYFCCNGFVKNKEKCEGN